MVRILHVVGGMNRGGLETLIMNIYRNIDRTKIQFDFLVHTAKESYFDQEIFKLGGEIFRIPSRNDGIIKNRVALIQFFKKHPEYNIIHQHVSSLSYVTPLIVAKNNGVRTRIVHSHSSKLSGNKIIGAFHYLNRPRIKSIATHFFTCSDYASDWLYKDFIDKKNIKQVNNGIQIKDFIYNDKVREKKRKELKLSNELVIGHIGRFSYPKNHSFLLDSYYEIKKLVNDSKLLLIGDGPLRDEIEAKINDLDISDDVFLLGKRNDVNELLQAFDIFLFPSHYEGLPVTLVEAQAAGLKCIISDKITRQVEVTNLLNYKSLNDGPKSWAKAIVNKINYERKNMQVDLINSGFDIKEVTINLENFYLENK